MIPYFSLEKPYTDLNPCVSPKLWFLTVAILHSIHKALRRFRPNLRLRADTKCQSGTKRPSRFETMSIRLVSIRRYCQFPRTIVPSHDGSLQATTVRLRSPLPPALRKPSAARSFFALTPQLLPDAWGRRSWIPAAGVDTPVASAISSLRTQALLDPFHGARISLERPFLSWVDYEASGGSQGGARAQRTGKLGLTGTSYCSVSDGRAAAASNRNSKTGTTKAHNKPGAAGATATHTIARMATSATAFQIQCAELCCDGVKNLLSTDAQQKL